MLGILNQYLRYRQIRRQVFEIIDMYYVLGKPYTTSMKRMSFLEIGEAGTVS